MSLADASRLSYPAAVLFVALAAIYVFSFTVSVSLSRQYRRNTRLNQEIALLELRLRGLEGTPQHAGEGTRGRGVGTRVTSSGRRGMGVLLVTGSSGLIGSEAVALLRPSAAGRSTASTTTCAGTSSAPTATRRGTWSGCVGSTRQLPAPRPRHPRPRRRSSRWSRRRRPDLVIHCAAQPATTWPPRRPFDDFDVNAVGTLNLLEADPPARARGRLRLHEHQQGLRRRPQRAAAGRAARRAGTTPAPRTATGIDETLPDRPLACTACSAPARWRPT